MLSVVCCLFPCRRQIPGVRHVCLVMYHTWKSPQENLQTDRYVPSFAGTTASLFIWKLLRIYAWQDSISPYKFDDTRRHRWIIGSFIKFMSRPTYNAADTEFQVIEFHMLQKSKYFPLALASGFSLRLALYPLTLVKTRIQLQRHNESYSGTIDAFKKITKHEGVRGLYRGFGVTCFLLLPSLLYIGTYEGTRYNLKQVSKLSGKYRGLIAGCCASCMAQTFIVPIDVISQYLMVLGPQRNDTKASHASKKILYNPLKLPPEALKSRSKAAYHVVASIYKTYGVSGFYRGYFVSLMTYAPGSALWWFFYDHYCSFFQSSLVSFGLPRMAIQCISAPCSSVTVGFMTNPLDVLRARIQLHQRDLATTFRQLWKEEKLKIFTKSLSARLTQSVWHSLFIVMGYETVKRYALNDEYKDKVRW